MMSGVHVRLAFYAALTLLGLGSAGLACASVTALHDVENLTLAGSAAPSLLGPINELGRNGWQCVPERAALAKRAAEAEIPGPDRP